MKRTHERAGIDEATWLELMQWPCPDALRECVCHRCRTGHHAQRDLFAAVCRRLDWRFRSTNAAKMRRFLERHGYSSTTSDRGGVVWSREASP